MVLDVASQRVAERRESIRVAWLGTAGEFEVDHTGRDESDPTTWSRNRWTVQAGRHFIWVVVRDARGGVDWIGREVFVH